MKVDSAKGKLRYSLLWWPFIRQMAEVMEHGTQKHAANDWQKPTPYSLYFDAMQRHIDAWWEGETMDPDSGKHHLTHAACCAMILVWYHTFGAGIDDRQRRAKSQVDAITDGSEPGTAQTPGVLNRPEGL